MSAGTNHLVKEIQSVRALLKSRQLLGANDTALTQNYVNAMVKQITACKEISTHDGNLIMQALADSPYGDEGTKKIISAVDGKLQSSSTSASANANKPTQSLKAWWSYLTQEDWDFIRDVKRNVHAKMTRLVERANSIGLTHPDEQTIKWMLAVLVISHYEDAPKPEDLYRKLNELKEAIVSERKAYPHEHILEYPDRPSDLSFQMYEWAYTEEHKPVHIQLHGINSIADKIPLRKNSKLLRRGQVEEEPDDAWKSCKGAFNRKSDESIGISTSASSNAQLHVKAEPGVNAGGFNADADRSLYDKNDPDEVKLFHQFKADLWKLRATKSGSLIAQGQQVPHATESQSCIRIVQSPGGLSITPRTIEHVKQEPPTPDAGDASTADGDRVTADDLDEHAKAAIKAMEGKVSKKKLEEREKLAAKKAAKADAAGPKAAGVSAAVKKEKAKAKPKKAMKAVKAEHSKPSSSSGGGKVKKESVAVPAKRIMSAMPKGKDATPVLYKGGIVYTMHKFRKFRALRRKGDNYSGTSAAWGGVRTQKEAWEKVVKAIDGEYASKPVAKP